MIGFYFRGEQSSSDNENVPQTPAPTVGPRRGALRRHKFFSRLRSGRSKPSQEPEQEATTAGNEVPKTLPMPYGTMHNNKSAYLIITFAQKCISKTFNKFCSIWVISSQISTAFSQSMPVLHLVWSVK